ncbi:MAG TPA: hypothetical protein VD966_11610 [Pyrinomonadaceae bacterium]|nr:hypothetical protein [Pyrinomonadaceae bacterium]
MDLSFQTMNPAPDVLELSMVMGLQGFIPPFLQLPDLGLDLGLIETHHLMMLMHINAESFAERCDEVFFIQLRVTPNRLVINARSDLP